MKTTSSTLAVVLGVLISFVLAGCGGGAKTKMDTAEFSQAFSAADAAVKTPADAAVKALQAGNMLEGANSLIAVVKAGGEKLSEPQKNALINLGATVQMMMAEDGDKADMKVYQAVEDLMALINERESTPVGSSPDRVAPTRPAGQ